MVRMNLRGHLGLIRVAASSARIGTDILSWRTASVGFASLQHESKQATTPYAAVMDMNETTSFEKLRDAKWRQTRDSNTGAWCSALGATFNGQFYSA